ncbi:nucleotide exchange factor GrpE [bacterium]|nr:nucleotide exchange factor GrpE [bacterium]|tara:strand:+ start:4172 stop:4768 length:597 start_codon:yes stop_codon:yes gene_type:complete
MPKDKEEKGDSKKNDDNNDVEFIEEEQNSSSFSRDESDIVRDLKKKLKQCEKERKEYLDGWQRTKADSINKKKEDEKRREEFSKFAKEDLLHELLPVVDSFEMAFVDKKIWEGLPENWRKGVEYIYAQFMDTLKRNGLESVDPKGQPFDPNLHTAVETVESGDEKEDDIVLEVAQKGYMLHGRMIRPARVKVGEYKSK